MKMLHHDDGDQINIIPQTYDGTVRLPSLHFARIFHDSSNFEDYIKIAITDQNGMGNKHEQNALSTSHNKCASSRFKIELNMFLQMIASSAPDNTLVDAHKELKYQI